MLEIVTPKGKPKAITIMEGPDLNQSTRSGSIKTSVGTVDYNIPSYKLNVLERNILTVS